MKHPGKLRGLFDHLLHRIFSSTVRIHRSVTMTSLFTALRFFSPQSCSGQMEKGKDSHSIGKRFFFLSSWACENSTELPKTFWSWALECVAQSFLTIAEGIKTLKLNNVRTQQQSTSRSRKCLLCAGANIKLIANLDTKGGQCFVGGQLDALLDVCLDCLTRRHLGEAWHNLCTGQAGKKSASTVDYTLTWLLLIGGYSCLKWLTPWCWLGKHISTLSRHLKLVFSQIECSSSR